MDSSDSESSSRSDESSPHKPKAYSKYENNPRHMERIQDKERARVGKKGHFVNQDQASSSASSSDSERRGKKLPKAYGGSPKKVASRKPKKKSKSHSTSPGVLENGSIHLQERETTAKRTLRELVLNIQMPPGTEEGRHIRGQDHDPGREENSPEADRIQTSHGTLMKNQSRGKLMARGQKRRITRERIEEKEKMTRGHQVKQLKPSHHSRKGMNPQGKKIAKGHIEMHLLKSERRKAFPKNRVEVSCHKRGRQSPDPPPDREKVTGRR